MTTTLNKSLTQAEIVNLTVDERLELISALSRSLSADDIELSPEQEAEIKRRIEAYERDPSGGMTWADFRAELAKSRLK
jgi:putative addiction module component (TIGR02574 family)